MVLDAVRRRHGWWLIALTILVLADLVLLVEGRADTSYGAPVHIAIVPLAALIVTARAVRVHDRRAGWGAIAAGLWLWMGSIAYEAATVGPGGVLPVPSPADAMKLLAYVCALAGGLLIARAAAGRLRALNWLDGSIGGLAATSVMAALVFPAAVDSVRGDGALTLAAHLYEPVADVTLFGLIVAVVGMHGWRVRRPWGLLLAGLALIAVADCAYTILNPGGLEEAAAPLRMGWRVAALLIACAAWQRVDPPAEPAVSVRTQVAPAAFGLLALGVHMVDTLWPVPLLALALSSMAILLVVLRMTVAYSANMRALERRDHEANTDALTGIPNRRSLTRDLEDALERRTPTLLALYDLNGFKAYNDRFGHPAGDALLARLGGRLAEAMPPGGRAYRMGGDEFCLLVPLHEGGSGPVLRAGGEALSERGDGFSIDASVGGVVLPMEAARAEEALRLVDERMYSHKIGRRSGHRHQGRRVLLAALRERDSDLGEHMLRVAGLVDGVTAHLGLEDEERETARHAAELHDVGKVAVPDAILRKPGPLGAEEEAFMRRHTIIGERILSASPELHEAARVVRSTHERWDGAGYPDGLAREAIPLAARIIAVCDAYEAMTADRAYRAGGPPRAAVAELRRCAGSQFDPIVVAAFEASLAARAEAAPAAGEGCAVLDRGRPATPGQDGVTRGRGRAPARR